MTGDRYGSLSALRCPSVHRENTDRARSWRCQLVARHAGDHRSDSGHRHWPHTIHPTPTDGLAAASLIVARWRNSPTFLDADRVAEQMASALDLLGWGIVPLAETSTP